MWEWRFKHAMVCWWNQPIAWVNVLCWQPVGSGIQLSQYAWQQAPLSHEHSHWPWIINSLLWDKDDMLLVWFWSVVSCWRKKHGFAVPARLPGVPELALAVLCCLRCQVQLWAASPSLFLLFETGACWVARLVSPSFLCPAVRTSTCYHAWLRCLVQVFNSFTKIVTCNVYM